MSSSAPPHASLQARKQRLEQLEGFLREDPDNLRLLAEAFETALSCGEFQRAGLHRSHGESADADPWSWRLKQGDLLLAQGLYEQAHRALETLQEAPEAPADLLPVVAHNLAFIELVTQRYLAAVARLAPWLEDTGRFAVLPPALSEALQIVWLRSLHRAAEHERAWDWVLKAETAGRLAARALGIASLLALDMDDMVRARTWAQADAASARPTTEAMTTLASLALGTPDAAAARHWSTQVLQQSPEDGRALSVLGFAGLLDKDLPGAESHFRRATVAMAQHVGTWHGLALSLVLQGRLAQAQQIYEHTLELDRNFAETHGGLAIVHALNGDRQAAQQSAERALRLDGQSAAGTFATALLADEQGTLRQQLLAGIDAAAMARHRGRHG